jgi:site-specific DNA-methyltransferase (adenine-specific)
LIIFIGGLNKLKIMKITEKITITNEDCMDLLRRTPDNYYSLALVDPPYGLGDRLIKGGAKGGMGTMKNLADDKVTTWDDKIPPPEYFTELQRVSKNQIIWGGNYFLDYLGKTDGFIVWDKMNGTNPMADAELAWQNIKGTTRMFRWHHFSGETTTKIHPTQKPVQLYKWILDKYVKCTECGGSGEVASNTIDCDVQTCKKCKGNQPKILDTHLGSGSIAIAAHDYGFELTACELDVDYYNKAIERIKNHISQIKLEL